MHQGSICCEITSSRGTAFWDRSAAERKVHYYSTNQQVFGHPRLSLAPRLLLFVGRSRENNREHHDKTIDAGQTIRKLPSGTGSYSMTQSWITRIQKLSSHWTGPNKEVNATKKTARGHLGCGAGLGAARRVTRWRRVKKFVWTEAGNEVDWQQ